MSDSEHNTPDEPGSGAPPPPPEPPRSTPDDATPPEPAPTEPAPTEQIPAQPEPTEAMPEPTQAMPEPTEAITPPTDAPLIVPIDLPIVPPTGEPIEPVVDTPYESTTVIAAAGDITPADGLPPVVPVVPVVPVEFEEFDEFVPWYKRRGAIIALIVALALIIALLAWLLLADDDDEEDGVAPTASRLVLETVNETGAAIERGFIVDVSGPPGAEDAFVWLRPSGTAPGGEALVSSGSNGRAAFDWEPDETVTDPAAWAADVTIVEQVPAGWTPPGPSVECALDRIDAADSTVLLNVSVAPADPAVDRVATYTFPNYQFFPGDAVTCRLVSVSPTVATSVVETTVPATVVETTEVAPTTIVETTPTPAPTPATTVPPTTVPVTVPPTTQPPATTTTTSIDIAPPTQNQTLWDVIDSEDELTEFRQFVLDAGFDDELSQPNATFTIFAPTNDAFAAAQDENNPDGTLPDDEDDLRDLLLAHANGTTAYQLQELLLLSSIDVLFGNPQPITSAPPTVGGANILYQVPPARNGVLYLIDKVLVPVVD